MEGIDLYGLINEKRWDLVHDHMFHASKYFSVYNGYERIHYEKEWLLCLS